jgi:hypothetical protein
LELLVIAKLDRLSRNMAFIATLMDSKVEFIAADNPHANRLTIHILAAVAEHERAAISERTKAALAAAKRRGVKLGGPRLAAARKASIKVRSEVADAFARALTARRATYPAVCGKRATLSGNADRANRKPQCGRNRTNGWNVKWPSIRAWGQYHSRRYWIDGRRIRAAPKAPQRKRPCRSRALSVDPLI